MISARKALVALMLALTLATAGLIARSETISLAQTVPIVENAVCYLVDEGDDENVPAILSTRNFGDSFVRVGRLIFMCEVAKKYPVPATGAPPGPLEPPTETTITACYTVYEAQNNNGSRPYRLRTNNFGPDRVVVTRPVLMCEQASKTRIIPGTAPVILPPPANPIVFECFLIESGLNPQKDYAFVTRNFGTDVLHVGPGRVMCETAAKLRPHGDPASEDGAIDTIGSPTGQVAECFIVEKGDDPNALVVLNTNNFKEDRVLVHSPLLMCERAVKRPIFVFPVPDANPSAVLSSIRTGR